jgi:hypothetical protein
MALHELSASMQSQRLLTFLTRIVSPVLVGWMLNSACAAAGIACSAADCCWLLFVMTGSGRLFFDADARFLCCSVMPLHLDIRVDLVKSTNNNNNPCHPFRRFIPSLICLIEVKSDGDAVVVTDFLLFVLGL